jgi:protein-tyrosine-phosphatase
MDESDLVLTMTVDQAEKLKIIHSKQVDKIYPLKQYLAKEKGFFYSIEDPIGLSIDFYRKVFNEIKQEMERILPVLQKLAQN